MMEPIFQSFRVRREGPVVWLEINHGRSNEIGTEQLAELQVLGSWLRQDPTVAALVTWSRRLSKSGTPLFVAGANVIERVGWSDPQVKAHVRWQRAVLADLRSVPVLHVVVVGGVAYGWGCELLLAADYAIATDDARFALPETGLGILPGAGGTSELQRRIGPAQALRLGLTGEVIGADEALRIGLVQERTATVDEGLVRAGALAARAATRSPTANAAFKEALLASAGQPSEARQEIEARAYEACVDSGEAAIGRAWFAGGGQGLAPWGARRGGSGAE